MNNTIKTKAEKKFFQNALKNITTITDNSKLLPFYDELQRLSQTMVVAPPIPLNIDYCKSGEMLFMFSSGKKTAVKESDFVKMYHEHYYNISILPCKDGVEIERFEVYETGSGIGSYLMEMFNTISIELAIPLYLKPGTPGYKDTYRSDSDDKRRRAFYHRHGFKRMASSEYWKNTEVKEITRTDICLNKVENYLTEDETEVFQKFLLEIAEVALCVTNQTIDYEKSMEMLDAIGSRNENTINPILNGALRKMIAK